MISTYQIMGITIIYKVATKEGWKTHQLVLQQAYSLGPG
jgi:hypothetical protein